MFGCLKFIRRLIVFFTVAGIAVIALAAGTVLTNAHRHDDTSTDAIVVLGAAQYAGKPTPLLRNRLDHARVIFDKGVSSHIITVGGKRAGDRMTEAEAGKRYLHKHGIAASHVIAAKSGSNTWTSMQAVTKVCQQRQWKSVTIVSDPTHVGRAAAMARRLGLIAQVSPTVGGSGSRITAAHVVRESFGLLWFWTQRLLPTPLRDRWQA
jgi:uncharacterized SAM-binding protein YcdF (DUF218 family)